MYFDSHAHLGEDCFTQDFVHIVENMRTAGVSGMMEIGFDGPSSYHAVELANRYDWIWAAVGSHPDDAAQVDEARIEEYRALCEDPRVKAIGEIGLDYHYSAAVCAPDRQAAPNLRPVRCHARGASRSAPRFRPHPWLPAV